MLPAEPGDGGIPGFHWGAELRITGIKSVTVTKKPPHANRQTELLITFVEDDGVEVPEGGFPTEMRVVRPTMRAGEPG